MKNLLLILAFAFVGFVDAQEKDYIIEKIEVRNPNMDNIVTYRVLCIQNYVFLQDFGGTTQLMRKATDDVMKYSFPTPMKCNEYKKRN
jgi:hypothetical protein